MAQTARTYVLTTLVLVYTFNFVDRQILSILGPAIIADLDLSDSQFGLLTGLVFAVFYTALGLPIAWLAERWNRITIIGLSLATWSGFTFATAYVQNFTQLALMRVGVAVGEAGGTPPAHSVISDLYDEKRRAWALGIYSLGIPIGYMVAYFTSAALATAEDVNWRLLFQVVGVPGIVIALLLFFTVKEPQRTTTTAPGAAKVPFFEALKRLLAVPSYWLMTLGISFASFAGYGLAAFIVVYARRAFPDVPYWELLIAFGIINGVFYGVGTFLGGYLSDKYAEKRGVGAYALVPAFGMALSVPALLLSALSGDYVFFLLGSALFVTMIGMYLGPTYSVVQTLAPSEVRATSSAVMLFVLNLIALGGGPTVVGWLSDSFGTSMGDPTAGLRWALLAMIVPSVLSIGVYLAAAKRLPRDWPSLKSAADLVAESEPA